MPTGHLSSRHRLSPARTRPSPARKKGRNALPAGVAARQDGQMPKRVVILGGGTGGTLSANRLRRLYPTDDLEIVVVDQDDAHVYQPGLLFVPFGLADADEIVRSRAHQLHKGIEFRQVPIDHVDTESDSVQLQDGTVLEYDVLVVATGCVLVEEKGVALVTEFNTGEVDGPGGRLVSYDGREVGFDLAVVVPLHGGAAYVSRSPGLGDDLGFVPVDVHTLQSTTKPNVFAIGDAAGVPTSKAGSVTHFEGEVLVENIRRFLADEPLDGSYDGHANCFIETGFGKALLIDFNYDVEPLPGHFPAGVGLPLLKESRLNHLGKLMFQPLYWHSLLPGHDLPGVGSAMPTRGKDKEGVP